MKNWQVNLSPYISKVYVRPNLPLVLVGGFEGYFWAINSKGSTSVVEFPSKPEIAHIETLENSDFILLAANNVLLTYNIITGERQQLLVVDSKISCISYDETRERIYVGLWSNENNKKTLMAFNYKNLSVGDMVWSLETGDIVRSICVQPGQISSYILVGSENKTVLCLNSDGKILDKFIAPNRITKIRTYSKKDQTIVLVISDAPELLILKFEEGKLLPYKAVPLDARPGNVFLCTLNGLDYIIAITPLSLGVYKHELGELALVWEGDGSRAHIKSLYWWPYNGQYRFIVERHDSTLACYEFSENRIETMMENILESESTHAKKFLGDTLYTHERVYDTEYLPTKQKLFVVAGDGQLIQAKIDIKLSIPLTLKMNGITSLHDFQGDRLRTLAILDINNENLAFLGGEKGIVYKYSILNRTIASTPPLQGWIYDSTLITLKNDPYLLILCEKGLYIFDKNLDQMGSFEISDDKFRCLYWDNTTNRTYIGSETGLVYLLKSPTATVSGISWENQNYEIISRAQRKIRNISSINASGKRLIVIGTEDGTIYAIDYSGNIVWSYLFGQWVRDFDIVRKNENDLYVVVVGHQRYLDFIDTESGKLIHRYEIPYEPRTVKIFKYWDQVGMVVTELSSNLHLYTLSTKQKKLNIINPLELPTRFVEGIKSLITGKNIIRFAIFIVGLIAFLANMAQIIDFVISFFKKILPK